MEPNLAPQTNMPNMEDMQLPTSQIQSVMENSPMNKIMQPRRTNLIPSCLTGLIPVALIFIFIFFGGKIFGFFHIENVYHFIISLFVFLVLYVVALVVAGLFIKYPKDILTIVVDRLKN